MAPITVSADGKWLAIMMAGVVREGGAKSSSLPKEAGIFEAVSEDLAGAEVFIVERETGTVTRPFQQFAASFSPAWAPAGATLALAVQDSITRLPRVATWTPDGGGPHIFSDAPFRPTIGFTAPTWTPDGKRLVFPLFDVAPPTPPRLKQSIISGKQDVKMAERPVSRETLAVMDVANGEVRAFKGFGPFEYSQVWGFRLSPDGKRAAFLARAQPLKQEAEANWVRLTVVDLDTGNVQTIGTQQMDGWGMGLSNYGQTRTLSWKLADGQSCQGTLLLPVGWKEGDKPPVVMDVYGGVKGKGNQSPEAMNEASNIINPHLLAASGYAFFLPDMPQTGEEPAASLVRSAEAAVEALHASGLVDGDRAGIMGQSYGGYTALCVLTGSKRFKAGIVANGTYDLIRMSANDSSYATAWVEADQGRMGATLWEKTQRYIDNSPFFALDRLQTPLLVLQGSADALSNTQGPALFAGLRRLGKPAEYLVGTNMDHVPVAWSIETQKELIPRVLAFLNTNLKTPNKL